MAMCRKCKGELQFSFSSVGIWSQPTLMCTRKGCGNKKESSKPELLVASTKKTSHTRLTDFPVNILYVLGFLSVGDGGTEAQRVLGMLDLPNLTSMEKSTFSKIEQEVAPVIVSIAEEAMFDNLVEEIRNSDHPEEFDIDKWKKAVADGDETYALHQYAKIKGSTDMGWQKRGSGFDSLSGHSFFFGAECRKPLYWMIKNKYCKICNNAKDGDPVREHECLVNHTGSAASMESLATVDMLHDFHDKFKCHLSMIIKLLINNNDFIDPSSSFFW